MKDKVYDFLPAHLKNDELENIFNATIDRVFSKGNVEKVRSFVGRKEKGIYSRNNSYLNYPNSGSLTSDYSFEPVYSNMNVTDNIFYDDLINLIYNKGGLTNDHRRMFTNSYFTINLPIDTDKFCNWAMYYWVYPNFDGSIQGSSIPHYVTIDRGENNWWSHNNSWYHFEDIKELLTPDNKHLIKQATRPIIEFDKRLVLSNTSQSKSISELDFEEPTFKVYNSTDTQIDDVKLFSYVTGTAEDYPYDSELMMFPKLIAGDYFSEYVFTISLLESNYCLLADEKFKIYIPSNFNYRNVRQEKPDGIVSNIVLEYEVSSENDIDVYVNGIKQIGNYSLIDGIIILDEPTYEYVYVDYKTLNPILDKKPNTIQLINPSVEYNPDNISHVNKEFSYSTIFDHLIRIIETTTGLIGQPISNNNFRTLTGSDKTKYNDQGSIMIKSNADISLAYFAIARDDYNPFVATEMLSSAYNSFKNKLVLTIQDILMKADQANKTDTEILEEALQTIAINKSTVYKVYEGIGMLDYGVRDNHYEELQITNVIGSFEQFMPAFSNAVVNDEDIAVYVNGKICVLGKDYVISQTGGEIIFSSFAPTSSDVILVRNYINREDLRIPPSSTKLGISPSYIPHYEIDGEFETPTTFIVGHDGSKTPRWNDRTDDILMEYEIRVYNKLSQKSYDYDYMNYGAFKLSNQDYTNEEKNHIAYPFFKKWMIKNEISNMYNEGFNPSDWKTWNYSTIDSTIPGNWRGIYFYLYGTDNVLHEPWKVLKLSEKPDNFDTTYGTNYSSPSFWSALITENDLDLPIPVDTNGDLKTIDDLLYSGSITAQIIQTLNSDWNFGDGSPIEMAWRRSSEYPFISFIQMMLQKPFDVISQYSSQIENIVKIYAKILGIDINAVIREKNNYTFKLGSKLSGFVNNFSLLSENVTLRDSKYTEIPSDNYDLFIHSSVPDKSENFSAVTVEKVSMDKIYPNYNIAETADYLVGDIVLNPNDGKYYKRKSAVQTQKEIDQTVAFDYSAWILVPQPVVKEFGYRIHGYIDLHPEFHTYEWDIASGQKVFETAGDKMVIANWKQDTYYRINDYVVYNEIPYVCLETHTSSTTFGLTKWKAVGTWPRVNKVYAYGYEKTDPTRIKTYRYGDILKTVDDVVHLLVGYQDYLTARGWAFVDIFENSYPINFENLVPQFLDWSAEKHQVGEYISLTPIKENGEFTSQYGVAKVSKETFKNFYRVVDANGEKISENDIKFYSTGNRLTWKSTKPVYGMIIDIADIQHAFVVDREDSYGDTIYDPLNHNRSLRVMVDCNRVVDWDGTMEADGFIVYGNRMVPNFETMIEEIRNYGDTILDQSLENINLLKASQIGFFPREYFTRMGIERESQLEFYKGFITAKGTKDSINRLVNLESNITDIENSDVWAFKISEYGNNNSRKKVSTVVNIADMKKNPHVVTYNNIEYPLTTTTKVSGVPIKTVGYVNSTDVTHVVVNSTQLSSLDPTKLYEGDIAWLQFDDDREWDTRRLSEIAEIVYLGETPDAQLYIALTNQIDTSSEVFLKIVSSGIQPNIQGYYYPVFDSVQTYNGLNVYLYLIFDMNYEAVIVEIDTSTSNSIYVPTQTIPYVEANGSIANPSFEQGDTIVINGTSYSYNASGIGTSQVQIYGSEFAVNPFVQSGERIRISVFDSNGQLVNNNSTVTFSGTVANTTLPFAPSVGDEISIDGTILTVEPSFSANRIVIISDNTELTEVPVGSTIEINSSVAATFNPVSVIGTVNNISLSQTKALNVNGTVITFTVPSGTVTGANSVENFLNVSTPVNSIQLTSDMTNFLPGNITVTNGVDTPYVLTPSAYSYNQNTKVITFDSPIQDGQQPQVSTVTQTIVGDGSAVSFTLTGPFNTADRIIVGSLVDGTEYNINGSNITFVAAPALGSEVLITYETDTLVNQNGLVDISVQLVAQPVAQSLDVDDVVSIINASSAPIVASKEPSGALKITYTGAVLTMNGSVLINFGLSTTSSFRKTAFEDVVNQLNAISFIDAFVNSDKKLQIETGNNIITLSGTALVKIGIEEKTYESTNAPTKNSVVEQINSLGILNLTASVTPSGIQIYKNNHTLTISEVTSGAMQRMGFSSPTVTVNASQLIADQINQQAFANDSSIGTASVIDSRIKIVSPQNSISISSLNGNALDDIGIPTGTYLATISSLSTANAFKDQINSVATDVVVSISSDGRMVFVGNNNVISFAGTSQQILDKIGLYVEYTSITSSNDFKVMKWKSVRYTPYYNGTSFMSFYDSLGLNGTSYIWADDYDGNGWAVVYRNPDGSLQVTQRQAPRVDVENINRLLVTDDQSNHYMYSLYDPLNLKFPGDIGSKISYVSWQDPAQYEFDITTDKWTESHVGEIWWDTTTVRYYRYNDYGDANGNIVQDYARKYWGKIVPNSEVKIYRWTAATKLPDDVTRFNTVTYIDPYTNENVNKYYFWTSESIGQEESELTPSDIKMMIENKKIEDNFIPVSPNKILVSNSKLKLKGSRVRFELDYFTDETRHETHSDWHLVSEKDADPVPEQLYQELIDSLSGVIVDDSITVVISNNDLNGGNVTINNIDFLNYCNFENSVVTINSSVVHPSELNYNGDTLTVNTQNPIVVGDVLRLYKISTDFNNWFKDINEARRNFAYIVNEYLKRKFIDGFAYNWKEYVATFENSIVSLDYWALNEKYDTIKYFEYLSKTRSFDMNSLYQAGIQSFKVSTDVDEYFFPVDGFLRMVHRTNSSLRLSYDQVITPRLNTIYYQNLVSVQTIEFMNMMKEYADNAFLKSLFIEMVKYMLTEKTYPEFVFKTSYFDLIMKNNGLKQSAVYLRDYYDDMIDYINDTKPYHAKIRDVKNCYSTSENVNSSIIDSSDMSIMLKFGNSEYFTVIVDSEFDAEPTIKNIGQYFNPTSDTLSLTVYINGVKIRDQYYKVENGDLVFSTNGDVLDGTQYSAVSIKVGDVITIVKNISRFDFNKVEGNATINTENNYDGGYLLQPVPPYTNFGGGIDTGFVSSKSRDIMVVSQNDYTDGSRTTLSEKKFYVYDQFGRGYEILVDKIGTVSAFDGTTVTVNQQSYFKEAKGDTKRLSILDNGSSLEFFLYDKKTGTELRISDRGVYTGKMGDFGNGDTIYSVKSVTQI